MECCPICHEYGMYCTCEDNFQSLLDELWEHNIDARTHDYEMDEFDEYYQEKYENSLPSDEWFKQQLKDEVEMLVELGYE